MNPVKNLFVLALCVCGASGCTEDPVVETTPTLAVAPFAQTGDAESGPYALALMNVTTAVAAEFGSRTDWSIMESDRIGTLEEELDYAGQEIIVEESITVDAPESEYPELAGASITAMTSVEIARAFPSADYVLIGSINGFDVAPVRVQTGAALSTRRNRIRSSIDYRIVETETREWIASDTVILDEVFDDDNRAETQVNAFLRYAAAEVSTRALRQLAGQLTVESAESIPGKQVVRLSGGTGAGLRIGDEYRVETGSLTAPSTNISVTEVFPGYAIADNSGEPLMAGSLVTPVLVPATVADNAVATPVQVGLMPCLSKDTAEYANPFAITVRNRLTLYMDDYDGIEIVENRQVIRDKALGEQLLDDLSKGREVGLPLGSLRGVDYLIVCNIESIELASGSQSVERHYDVDVVSRTEPQLRTRGSAYVIDVNSAVRIGSTSVDSVATPDPADSKLVDAADKLAQDMFGELMLSLRPLAIAQIGSDTLTLNHKESVGITVGTEFDIYSPGEDVEANGEVLVGLGGSQVGRLRVTGFDAVGWIQAELTSGDSVNTGFLLRPVATTNGPAETTNETIW